MKPLTVLFGAIIIILLYVGFFGVSYLTLQFIHPNCIYLNDATVHLMKTQPATFAVTLDACGSYDISGAQLYTYPGDLVGGNATTASLPLNVHVNRGNNTLVLSFQNTTVFEGEFSLKFNISGDPVNHPIITFYLNNGTVYNITWLIGTGESQFPTSSH